MSIHVILGGMFSGKTTELFRILNRARCADYKTRLYKYEGDVRYSQTLAASHDGIKEDALCIRDALDIEWEANMYIGIDEGQFISNLPDVAEYLANKGVHVVITCLDSDWKRQGFTNTQALVPISDRLTRLHAICHDCKGDASFSKRIVDSEDQELIGGKESYKAVCRICFFK